MELTWSESYLIVALRVLMPFFRKHGFKLSNLEYGFRDGDFLEFKKSVSEDMSFNISYNPGFDIIINRKVGFRLKEESLVELKRKSQDYSQLPEDYQGQDELSKILKEYTLYIEKEFLTN